MFVGAGTIRGVGGMDPAVADSRDKDANFNLLRHGYLGSHLPSDAQASAYSRRRERASLGEALRTMRMIQALRYPNLIVFLSTKSTRERFASRCQYHLNDRTFVELKRSN